MKASEQIVISLREIYHDRHIFRFKFILTVYLLFSILTETSLTVFVLLPFPKILTCFFITLALMSITIETTNSLCTNQSS